MKLFLIFTLFFAVFFFAHLYMDVGGFVTFDDPYYHAKHALLIEQSGQLNLIEPWLEFNFLNYAPVDPWWGFHLAMALFIHWFGLFLGVKIFVSFLAALIFSVFYLILNELKVKYPSAWTLFLFFSSIIFIHRLFLERPHLLSIIVLPLALLLLVKGKNFWLFILSLFYALSYHLAPLIILPVLIYLAVDAYTNKRINLKPLIASTGGILVGIIIHPDSLNYLYVMFITLVKILFFKFSGVDLHVGNEIQIISFFDFLSGNYLALLSYILAAALFLSLRKLGKNSVISNFLFLYSSLWFIVTLLLPRGAEYWLPAAVLFAAVIFNDFFGTEEFRTIKKFLTNKINFKVAGFFLVSTFILVVGFNLSNVFCELFQIRANDRGGNYQQANDWLKANTKKGSVVFYDNWGMWPMMFFYNDYNHYIIGIDPTLTYEYDKRAYWLWRNISAEGLYCDQQKPCFDIKPSEQIKLVPVAIKSVFRAKYVVASNYETSNLIKTLNNLRSEVKLVFKNKDLLIYEIK